MSTLFDQPVKDKMFERVNKLSAASPRKWGKMNASQMLKHMSAAFALPVSKEHPKKESIYYLMANPVSRWLMFDVIPWPHAMLPSPEAILVKDDPDFESARAGFMAAINNFLTAPEFPGSHPVFGSMDKTNWGKLMTVHLDHHLRQFGV